MTTNNRTHTPTAFDAFMGMKGAAKTFFTAADAFVAKERERQGLPPTSRKRVPNTSRKPKTVKRKAASVTLHRD